MLYTAMMAVIFTCFITYQCTHRPQPRRFGPPPMEMRMRMHNPHRPPRDFKRPHQVPAVFIGQHDIVAVVILVLMFGMNIGIKLFFKNRYDQKKLESLQKKNLEQQLEYLKYQINPHFFMNTLNNIHALVDIDPEKAKGTILELSKMMRFVLYEGDKKGVPLSKEFEFIRTYIQLMKLRYTDKVKISVNLPTEAPDKTVPPLMLISFIENAFKHGISYQHESFIDIKVSISNDRLHFTCRNSKADKAAIEREQSDACIDSAEREQARPEVKPNEEKGGVGLQNVKQRLNLLYDNNYTLKIQDESDVYSVDLTIPL
jgi:LytS/YehU family sensor histidine kinase